MLIVFGSYEKHKEVKKFDFSADLCPECNQELRVMESSRHFSFMYLINFKTETLGYYYFCPKCNREFSTNDIKQLKPNTI